MTSAPVLIGLHLTSYVTIAIALWVHRRLPGLLLIAAGGGTNAAVIALNGGTLPASAGALREAGYTVDPSQFKNSGVLIHPVLPWLGDIAATPTWLPFRNVISIATRSSSSGRPCSCTSPAEAGSTTPCVFAGRPPNYRRLPASSDSQAAGRRRPKVHPLSTDLASHAGCGAASENRTPDNLIRSSCWT